LAPFAAHFESLTQPFTVLSLGALAASDFAATKIPNTITTVQTNESFFIDYLLKVSWSLDLVNALGLKLMLSNLRRPSLSETPQQQCQ
jgi:hypothetical protein